MDKKKIVMDLKARVGLLTVLLVCAMIGGFMFAMVYNFNPLVDDAGDEQIVGPRINKRVDLGNASLVSGNTCVMYIMSYPHAADPWTTYATDLVNGSAYEYYDYLDNELTGETPYGTAFDLVIGMAVNTTHGYDTIESAWNTSWFNASMHETTSNLNFTSDVALNEVEIGSDATWMYLNLYLQDADGVNGSGFQLGNGETFNCTFEFWSIG